MCMGAWLSPPLHDQVMSTLDIKHVIKCTRLSPSLAGRESENEATIMVDICFSKNIHFSDVTWTWGRGGLGTESVMLVTIPIMYNNS